MIVAGTGHRPDKLGGYSEEAFGVLERTAYNWLHINRPEKVISGGALGWDQALATASFHHGMPYIMALPFKDFECRWPKSSQDTLHKLCDSAAEVVYVCEDGYAPWKMQKRNEWMVDNCDLVLALWNGTSGGTANCLRYAGQEEKEIVNLWEKYHDISN